jgi:hypothetical protein
VLLLDLHVIAQGRDASRPPLGSKPGLGEPLKTGSDVSDESDARERGKADIAF